MTTRIAFVVYDGFNELDVFACLYVVARAGRFVEKPVSVHLVGNAPDIRSMYGVEVAACPPLAAVSGADAVVVGSGGTQRALADATFMSGLRLDASSQLIGSQCSGALVLAKLGLLRGQPACVDAQNRERMEAAGVPILEQPFHAAGPIATAGGCLASPYLATWLLWRLFGPVVAHRTLGSVAPVGEPDYVTRITDVIATFV